MEALAVFLLTLMTGGGVMMFDPLLIVGSLLVAVIAAGLCRARRDQILIVVVGACSLAFLLRWMIALLDQATGFVPRNDIIRFLWTALAAGADSGLALWAIRAYRARTKHRDGGAA